MMIATQNTQQQVAIEFTEKTVTTITMVAFLVTALMDAKKKAGDRVAMSFEALETMADQYGACARTLFSLRGLECGWCVGESFAARASEIRLEGTA